MTNEDLYRIISTFDEEDEKQLALEEYLSALWEIVSRSEQREPTPEQFIDWLHEAFYTVPPPFDNAWKMRSCPDTPEVARFMDWESTILFQIAALRRMKEAGIFESEQHVFGTRSPSGDSWYNFTPLAFLECGGAGSFLSREQSTQEVKTITWAEFIRFLKCGQYYE